MEVKVQMVGRNAEDELRSLRDWLAVDDAFRGRVRLDAVRPGSEDMGTVIDLLTVAVGSGGAATVLAGSISTWLRTRRSDVTVEIIESVSERTVRVTGSRVEDAEAIIRDVLGTKDG